MKENTKQVSTEKATEKIKNKNLLYENAKQLNDITGNKTEAEIKHLQAIQKSIPTAAEEK